MWCPVMFTAYIINFPWLALLCLCNQCLPRPEMKTIWFSHSKNLGCFGYLILHLIFFLSKCQASSLINSILLFLTLKEREEEEFWGENWQVKTQISASRPSSLVVQMVKNLPAMKETQVRSLHWEDPPEKGMATYSSILTWRIPWTEEPDRL